MSTIDHDYMLGTLTELGFVSPAQLSNAQTEAKPGEDVVGFLLRKKLLTPAQIMTATAHQFGIETVELRDRKIIPEVVELLVDPTFPWTHQIIPFEKTEHGVAVAMVNPSDLNTIDTLSILLNTRIEVYVVAEDDLEEALKHYYPVGEEAGKAIRHQFGSMPTDSD